MNHSYILHLLYSVYKYTTKNVMCKSSESEHWLIYNYVPNLPHYSEVFRALITLKTFFKSVKQVFVKRLPSQKRLIFPLISTHKQCEHLSYYRKVKT